MLNDKIVRLYNTFKYMETQCNVYEEIGAEVFDICQCKGWVLIKGEAEVLPEYYDTVDSDEVSKTILDRLAEKYLIDGLSEPINYALLGECLASEYIIIKRRK